jgi:hypothetical protein
MHAFPQVEIDSGMTLFLSDFVKHGAKFAGLISVEQTLNDTTAKDIQRRFQEYHGGSQNWSQPLVLGNGSKYETMQLNFRDMAFGELDARSESRICNAFDIDPIVANARAGLDVSSYNNKSEADKNWMHTWLVPSWQEDAETITEQLLPYYHDDIEHFYCEFHTSDVWGLNEDRDSLSKRIVEQAKIGLIDRDEGREALDYDPIDVDDNGEPLTDEAGNPIHTWLNVTIRESGKVSETGAAGTEALPGQEEAAIGTEGLNVQADTTQPMMQPKKPKMSMMTDAEIEASASEEKKFRTYARARVKEGKSDLIPEYEFKFVSSDRQAQLLTEFEPTKYEAAKAEAQRVIDELSKVLEKVE